MDRRFYFSLPLILFFLFSCSHEIKQSAPVVSNTNEGIQFISEPAPKQEETNTTLLIRRERYSAHIQKELTTLQYQKRSSPSLELTQRAQFFCAKHGERLHFESQFECKKIADLIVDYCHQKHDRSESLVCLKNELQKL